MGEPEGPARGAEPRVGTKWLPKYIEAFGMSSEELNLRCRSNNDDPPRTDLPDTALLYYRIGEKELLRGCETAADGRLTVPFASRLGIVVSFNLTAMVDTIIDEDAKRYVLAAACAKQLLDVMHYQMKTVRENE